MLVEVNPASSVRGPKHVVKRGKTAVLKSDEARLHLDSIKIDSSACVIEHSSASCVTPLRA